MTPFELLVLTHFVTDWVFQTHDTAMRKPYDDVVRRDHCITYALSFVPYLLFCIVAHGANPALAIAALVWLYYTHFYEDTYKPVIWWLRNVRKIPLATPGSIRRSADGFSVSVVPSEQDQIKTFIATPLGTILLIAIDQIVHIVALTPLAFLAGLG